MNPFNILVKDLGCPLAEKLTDFADIVNVITAYPDKKDLILSCIKVIKTNSNPNFVFTDATTHNFPNLEEVDMIIRVENLNKSVIYSHPTLRKFKLLSDLRTFLYSETLENFCSGTFVKEGKEYTKNVNLDTTHLQFFTYAPRGSTPIGGNITTNSQGQTITTLNIHSYQFPLLYKTWLLEILGSTIKIRGYDPGNELMNTIKKHNSLANLVIENQTDFPLVGVKKVTFHLNFDEFYNLHFDENEYLNYKIEEYVTSIIHYGLDEPTDSLNFEFATRLYSYNQVIDQIFFILGKFSIAILDRPFLGDLHWVEMDLPLYVEAFYYLAPRLPKVTHFKVLIDDIDDLSNLDLLLNARNNISMDVLVHPGIKTLPSSVPKGIKIKRLELVEPLPDVEFLETTFIYND